MDRLVTLGYGGMCLVHVPIDGTDTYEVSQYIMYSSSESHVHVLCSSFIIHTPHFPQRASPLFSHLPREGHMLS